ncbi:flagellar hook-basal body complex protein [Azospirillum sp. RWY-5-1]|uniref:Flagellar hook protein FlgE n=1 Tax=Azospirillum oleiclasticum TaxID=2735135 RepID=A0ABX2TLH7_9PROT|nr:flagellar hook-basal body complex protein [Azospirillum oleiclasticum]NYZ16371.1 flagellar hook-basal body complex protein [Azospirillum oleiclasticum]NYZ23913.1 flagellar hook-basal body complex protein [Azospirillum oleiclasticum]
MSIYGSLTTAVTGLNAQARALGHISDNIANAQTIGYKRVNSAFETLVLQSNSRIHSPGGVMAQPIFANNIQGSLTQVQSPTNVAIQGAGFFSVSKLSSGLNGPGQVGETVQTQTGTLNADNVYYTRAGDFELDQNRYLVNSAGFALNGWTVDPLTNQLNKDVIQPIQVNTLIDRPEATKSIDYAANLPANPTPGVRIPTSSIQVFDTQGNARTVNLNWRQQSSNDWRLTVEAPGSSAQPVAGSFTGNPVAIGLGQNIPGQTAIPQVTTITVGGNNDNGVDRLRIGETYTVNVDGTDYSLKITKDNVASIRTYSGLAGAIANQINSASPSPPVIATVDGAIISLTARNAGTPFRVTKTVDQGTATNNTVSTGTQTAATTSTGESWRYSFPQTQIDIGDVFSVTVDTGGTEGKITASVTVTAANYASFVNMSGVTEALANKFNQMTTLATASSTGSVITFQMDAAGASFPAAVLPQTLNPEISVDNVAAGNNTLTVSTTQTNVAGVRQQQTVTLTGTPGDVGAIYTLQVNGTPVTYTTTGSEMTMAEITAALANSINSNTSLPVTASSSGGVIQLTAKTASTPAVTNTFDTVTTVPTATVTLGGSTQIDVGDTYRIEVAGEPFELPVTAGNYEQYDTPAEVMAYFASAINAAAADGTIPATYSAAVSGTNGLVISGVTVAGDVTSNISNATAQQFSVQQTAVVGETPAHIGLTFGTTPETVGTLTRISTAFAGTGTAITAANQNEGSEATITFTVNYGFGEQQITLNLGQFQRPGGVTQYAGSEINVLQFVQDGVPRGQFKDVVFGENGEVLVNYDNGRSKTVARVPVVTFNNPNALQRDAGGVFLETAEAGKPNFNDAGQNGSGQVISNTVEGSNVDIADEFTKLIVTQRTYSANTKIVTTSDEMLQEVLGLKR